MPTQKLVLLLGLCLAPPYAAFAVQQIRAVCSCGHAHTGPCPTGGVPGNASNIAGVHALGINELPDGSWLPVGHYHGDGHDHSALSIGGGALSNNGGSTAPVSNFQIGNRWTRTATDGTVGSFQGTPVTLTWGIVADGTQFNNFGSVDDSNTPNGSNLVAFLDANVGNAADASITNLQSKSWFPVIASTYERWGEISGLTFVYEANDDGLTLTNTGASQGVLGVRADMRLSGASVDGQSGPNTLAFNFFPNNGDGLIDTDNTNFFGSRFNNFRGLRNTLAHEIGHGIGIQHVESSDASFLLEPFVSLGFDGPQVDDILAAQRNYGDPREANGGNDVVARADVIGAFGGGDTFGLGTDGDTLVVTPDQTDFISIDGLGDIDLFRFTVQEPVLADLTLTQVGRSYFAGPEGGTQVLVNNSTRNELRLELLTLDDTGVLNSEAQATPLAGGLSRSVEDFVLTPGEDYFLRVNGTVDDIQLYELGLSFVAVPEPAGAALLLLGMAAGCGRWRPLDAQGRRAA